MTFRETCGTLGGAVAHQAAGEPLCGACTYADQLLRISAEGIPSRPKPPGWLAPVTPDQAVINAAVLEAELEALENEGNAAIMTRRRYAAQQRHLKALG
jgi:hypothetical protein